MAYHIMVATTKGLVAIQKIYPLDPELGSVVSLRGTPQALPITSAYRSFVKKGLGLIHEDFDGASYRVNVSGEIHKGNSWQLGFYLAHAAQAQGVLGNGEPEEGDIVICATGAINSSERTVLKVSEVPLKLTLARAEIQAWQQICEVKFVLPSVNHKELDVNEEFDLIPVNKIADAMELLPAYAATELIVEQNRELIPLNSSSSLGKWLMWSAPVLALMLVSVLHITKVYPLDFLLPVNNALPKNAKSEAKKLASENVIVKKDIAETPKNQPVLSLVALSGLDCDSNSSLSEMLTIEGYTITPLYINDTLCALNGKVNVPTQQMLLISADTRAVVNIVLKETQFSLPLPNNRLKNRQYWLVGFEHPLKEFEGRKVRGFLFELGGNELVNYNRLKSLFDALDKNYFIVEHAISYKD
ncbi:MAG: hypothetical protein ACJAVV_002342 [Alphaproteobacteria bacterium]|jgi:hypothetical protein